MKEQLKRALIEAYLNGNTVSYNYPSSAGQKAHFIGKVDSLGQIYRLIDEKEVVDLKIHYRKWESLTEEIEVTGERFVPVEWFEIGDDNNASLEYDHGNIKLIKELQTIAVYSNVSNCNFLPFGVVQKLIEWNFNVYNIPEDYCIYE